MSTVTTEIPLINTVKKLRLGVPTSDSLIDKQFYASEDVIYDLLDDTRNFTPAPLQGAVRLCDYVNKKINVRKMVDVNCFQGELTSIFALKLTPNMLHAIESFESKLPRDIKHDDEQFAKHKWDDVKHNFYLRAKKHPCIVLEEETSPEAFAATLEDNSLDFVYLGVNNSQSKTRRLLEAFYPKVRDGGMIAGGEWGSEGTVESVTKIIGNVDNYFDDGSWVKKIDKVKIKETHSKLKMIQNSRLGIGIQEQFWATDKDIKFLSNIDNPMKIYLTGFLDFVKYHKDNAAERNVPIKNIVEISCYQGETSSLFLKYFPDLEKLTVIDRFDKIDPSWPKSIALEDVRYNFTLRTEGGPVELIDDLDPLDAADKFEDNSIDLLYINEHESYQTCYRLLAEWLPKVKTDGFICGWRWGSANIVQACLDHFGEPDIYFKDSSWSKIKVWDNDEDEDDD